MWHALQVMGDMRLPRSIQLHPSEGLVHSYWRCHDKQFYLAEVGQKDLYRQCVLEGLKEPISNHNVLIHAYCGMDNHYHQLIAYKEGSHWLSRFMRQAHGLFGARYNRLHARSGKVAESRPKTSLIEDITHAMRVHFYIEANPIRAGLCEFENLQRFKHSSFRYYAFGARDQFTRHLMEPDWYIELAPTPALRQKRYRALFRAYLQEYGNKKINYLKPFIGSLMWVLRQVTYCKDQVQQRDSELYDLSNSS